MYFLTQPEAIFFEPKGKELKNLGFLGETYQTQTKTKMPDPTQVKKF